MGSHLASFSFPTATLFGSGALSELPARLRQIGAHRALVVVNKGLTDTHAFETLANHLGRSNVGRTWEIFDGVHSNPVEQDVINAAQAFADAGCDAIVGFGGGSALDVAKSMRLLLKRPSLKLGEFNFNDDWSKLVRCIAIPTTAGSGSEVRSDASIILKGTNKRTTLYLPRLRPKLVMLDPDVTRDLPAALTAATGIDALTHCIEAFTSPVFNPMCDGIALEAIRRIIDALPRAVHNGHDAAARGSMLVSAAMSGVACQKELGAAHALAHPLSAATNMHHGTAAAVCLPHVMHYNAQRKPGLYRRVGLACDLDVAHVPAEVADFRTVDFIRKFIADVLIKPALHHYGVREAQISTLARQAFEDSAHLTNPVPVNSDDLEALYRAAL